MNALTQLRSLWQHAVWADQALARALEACAPAPEQAWREYNHVLGAEAVWLDRLTGRAQRVPLWPTPTREESAALRQSLADEYATYIGALTEEALDAPVSYVNSAGQAFTTPVREILLHVAMHGQYHRGKVNLLLRQAGELPAPTDYISFVRGVPAAVTVPEPLSTHVPPNEARR
jgi:uncharacterized damage-inducible protein DinB